MGLHHFFQSSPDEIEQAKFLKFKTPNNLADLKLHSHAQAWTKALSRGRVETVHLVAPRQVNPRLLLHPGEICRAAVNGISTRA